MMCGCFYVCKWCSWVVYGKFYWCWSLENVVNEILELKVNYDFDKIWFVDDVFMINYKWLREFCCLMVEKRVVMFYEIISWVD